MKIIALILTLIAVTSVQAQIEIAPLEESQKGALQLNNALGQPKDAPFKLELDILKAFALKAGEVAMLAVPVHSLKRKIESANSGDIVPAGQLWLHKIVPDVDGNPATAQDLRIVEVDTADETGKIAMFHLAIRKHESKPELLVYGKGTTLIRKLHLRKMDVPQETPIELHGRKRDDTSGELSIYLGDHYEARMIVRPR